MRLSLVWKWSRHTNGSIEISTRKMVKIIVVILSLLNYFKQSHQCTRKKCPRSSHALLKKKNLNFLANLPFLFSSLFASTGGLAESRCDAERRLRWQRRKKRLSPKSNFFTFFLKTNNISGSLKIYHFGGNLFFYLKC